MEFEKIKKDSNTEIDIPFNAEKYIVDMSNTNKILVDYLTGKIPKGYTIGVECFDKHFTFKRHEFYVMTGKKGSGKTTINQGIQIMGSVVNGLKWVVAFQENDKWAMKLNYMNYLLGDFAKDVYETNRVKFESVSKWIDEHFIFIKVKTLKEATDVTIYLINEKKIDIYGLMLDPINSFLSGWHDTGNDYKDGVSDALKLLDFTLEYCSVYLNQHPSMRGQRNAGAVSSYDGEGGWFLNKASFTYVINREKGSNRNQIIVDNVRNKHTGGKETSKDNPVVIEWKPTSLNISFEDDTFKLENVIQHLVFKHRPFTYPDFEKDAENYSKEEFNKEFKEDDELLF